MENPLLRKLSTVGELDEDDCKLVEELCRDVRDFEPKQEIMSRGDRSEHVHVMLDGWAPRYKDLPDGNRQIVGFLIPGNFCGPSCAGLGSDGSHHYGALGPCKVAFMKSGQLSGIAEQRSRLTRALWWTRPS